MTRSLTFLGLLAASAVGLVPLPGLAASPEFKRVAVPFMDKYCYECHGGKKTKGDLDLKQFKDDAKILENRKLWLGALKQSGSGEMPPKKHPTRPTAVELAKFDAAINTALDRAEAGAKPDPGRVTIRRLNRNEYNHTVRDLLGVDFNAAENFPADDIGYGFDNIGDVLTLSPVHLERYLAAAETVAARAVPAELPKPPSRTTYSIFLEPSNYHSENGTRPVTNSTPELFTQQKITVAGDYRFEVRASATAPTNTEPVKMTLLLDDRELTTVTVTNRRKKWETFEVKLDALPVGEHRFAARFANRTEGATNRMLFINEFKVIGPADTRTDFQRRIAASTTGKPPAEQARAFVEWFVTRAFRRPATKEEIARYVKMIESAQAAADGKLEAGAQQLIKVVLCSPKFLFRIEGDEQPKARDAHPISDHQLASRLSYFLWNSMPDEELFALAAKKELGKNLDAQVRRMLKDPKA
ncbi:MAG: DUF1587 domain-containing protein, partial [Verrucomicrobia bacterium]|nr:DUF1587 domain-containing protein [Verrucomicrobiota bacterium]